MQRRNAEPASSWQPRQQAPRLPCHIGARSHGTHSSFPSWGGRSHPTAATAHLCGPPVPRLSGLNYRPCGEARRAQLSAWSWMRKQRLQGSTWLPGGTAGRWLGWNAQAPSQMFAASSGRCSEEAPNRYTAKGLPPNSRQQTAEGQETAGRTGSEQRGGRRWGQSLRGAQTPGCCQDWSQGNCSAPTGQAEQREASRPGSQGVIAPLAQHRGRCPGHV